MERAGVSGAAGVFLLHGHGGGLEADCVDIKNIAFLNTQFTEFVYMDSVSDTSERMIVRRDPLTHRAGQYPSERPCRAL